MLSALSGETYRRSAASSSGADALLLKSTPIAKILAAVRHPESAQGSLGVETSEGN